MIKKNVVIIGLGGVGGYFGFKINKYNENSDAHNIEFVARNETYKAIKEKGLILHSPEFSDHTTKAIVYENVAELHEPDLIIICVKEYDLENVCLQLLPVIKKDTTILPLMNGADIYDRIKKIIPDHTILPSCVYISAHIKEKGVIVHKSKPGKIIFGKDPSFPDAQIQWVADLLNQSQIDVELTANPEKAIWTKFMFIASFGLVTAKYNSSFGKIYEDGIQKQMATEIMDEIYAIALKRGIALDGDVIEKTFAIAMTFPYETTSSLQLDVNSKNISGELDLLGGSILKFGSELNIETPTTRKIYYELKKMIQK